MTTTFAWARWSVRPLLCLLGLHRWQTHPMSNGRRYCRRCGVEQRWAA